MQALRIETTVLPGQRIEIETPELPEGAVAEVIVLVPDMQEPRVSMLEFLGSLPPGPRLFATPADAEAHLQDLRAPDAMHAATAQLAGCSLFLTNDAGFRRVAGLPLAVLDEALAS